MSDGDINDTDDSDDSDTDILAASKNVAAMSSSLHTLAAAPSHLLKKVSSISSKMSTFKQNKTMANLLSLGASPVSGVKKIIRQGNSVMSERIKQIRRAESKGIIHLKQIAPNQTQVIFITHVDFKGNIPAAVINAKASSFLDQSHMILKFQRTIGRLLDKEVRDIFVAKLALVQESRRV